MRKSAVVLDVSSTTYCLLSTMNELWNRLEQHQVDYDGYKAWERDRKAVWTKVLRAQLRELLTLDWLKAHIELHEPVIFMAYDWKNSANEYWRHEWLRGLTPLLPTKQLKRRKRVFTEGDTVGKLVSELPPEPIAYKGGRDYSDNAMNRLKLAVRQELSAMGVCHLAKPEYEADDWMATVAMVNSALPESEQRDVILCCNDSDILGLVSDRVTWFDLPRQHRPLVRASIEDINRWRVEVKHEAPLEKPTDIWLEKAQYGDAADKLPPTGEAMLTLPAISLLEPPVEHRLWLDPKNALNITLALKGGEHCYNNTMGRVLMAKVNVVNVFA